MLTSGFPHSGNRGSVNDGSTSGFIMQNYNTAIAKINFSNDTSDNLGTALNAGSGNPKGGSGITLGWL